ncbi:hypothetical protein FJZ31_12465 [Candidatus Poribacteria bacterium]|nr:hypothetical protein [Candidatus Poribacteria bacterium]
MDSQPGLIGGHEEGGFVLKDSSGQLNVERWPKGCQNEIIVPPHSGGKHGNKEIIATFHTHPNTGSDFQQEPSDTDIRAVRDDPDLKASLYEGEYILTRDNIYKIDRFGNVNAIGKTKDLLERSDIQWRNWLQRKS